jgi:hypothetical protein
MSDVAALSVTNAAKVSLRRKKMRSAHRVIHVLQVQTGSRKISPGNRKPFKPQ